MKKSLWVVKSLYFFFYAGVGLFFTFLNVYYREIGLSGVQIGIFSTVGPLVSIFSMMLWGLFTDRFGKARLLLGVAVLGTIGMTFAISATEQFFVLLAIVCGFNLFNNPIMPVLDSISLGLLGAAKARYGMLRVWGSIGFILTTSAAGLIFERLGLRAMFSGYALILSCFLIASLWLPQQPVQLAGAPLKGLSQIIRQPVWLLFAASSFLLWIAQSGQLAFLSVSLKAMGGSESLIGLSYTAGAISEIPFMLLSGRLISRYGVTRLLALSFLAYLIRMVLYARMPSPEWALGINLLNGVTYALFWTCAVNYANALAPESMRTTAQSLLFSTLNLAGMVGASLSGWLFDRAGPNGLFQALAVSCLLALVLFSLGQAYLARTRPAATAQRL